MPVHVPVSIGELLDRITILALKCPRVGPDARPRLEAELAALEATWSAAGLPEVPERAALAEVNAALWDVEDRLRRHEAAGDFGSAFVALARSVYRLNDRRAALKRAVNLRLVSDLVEEKVLPHYEGKA